MPRSDVVSISPRSSANACLVLERLFDLDRKKEGYAAEFLSTRLVGNQLRFTDLYASARENYLHAAQTCTPHFVELTLTTEGPLAVGLGNETVLENGLSFNRIFGTPLIPGSSIKGPLTRAVASFLGVNEQILAPKKDGKLAYELSWSAKDWKKHGDASASLDLWRKLVGSIDAIAELTVFDAWWAGEGNPYMVDVITHHHDDYYQGKAALPLDSDVPVPSPFLSVKPGQPFVFCIGVPNETWKAPIEELLRYVVTEVGLGAKTNSGYGFFQGEEGAMSRPSSQNVASSAMSSAGSSRIQGKVASFDAKTKVVFVACEDGKRRKVNSVPKEALRKDLLVSVEIISDSRAKGIVIVENP
jgi:CRISPR-associated protein Cmr6